MAHRKGKHPDVALVPSIPRAETAQALRSDIKEMVAHARAEFHEDIAKVLTETAAHAAELEKAIGDLSQYEALEGVKRFFLDEIDRKLDRY